MYRWKYCNFNNTFFKKDVIINENIILFIFKKNKIKINKYQKNIMSVKTASSPNKSEKIHFDKILITREIERNLK